MIELDTLTIQNFQSYQRIQTINLRNRGLVLLSADNGAGKSSIFDAIVYCLYGQTLRELSSIEDVVNKKNKINCEVTLSLLDDSSGTRYRIVRTRACVRSKKPNDLRLYIDDKDKSLGTNTDTQALINTIIGRDFNTFCQSILLSSGERSFCRMSDTDQKQLLEDMLQITVFAKAHKETKNRLSVCKDLIVILEREINKQHEYLQDKKNQYHLAKKLEQEQDEYFDKQLISLKQKKVSIEMEIEEILAKDENILVLLQEEKSISDKVSELSLERSKEQADYDRQVSDIKEVLNKIRIGSAVQSSQRKELNQELSSMNNLGSVCTHCKQAASKEHKEKEIEILSNKIKIVEDTLEKLSITESKAYDSLKELKSNYDSVFEKFDLEIRGLRSQSTDIQNRIRERKSDLGSIKILDRQIKEISKSIQEHISQRTNTSNNKLIESIKIGLDTLTKEMEVSAKQLEDQRNTLTYLNYWERAFSNKGIKNYLLDEAIPYLNQQAKYYCEILSNNYLSIVFNTQSQDTKGNVVDKLSVSVVSSDGTDNYRQNSMGERRRSDIAIGWSFGDLASSRSSNFIKFKGLDEVFDNLDSEGEESVIKLLKSEVSKYGTIFVITHNEHLKGYFDNIITINKDNGFSEIRDTSG